MTENAHQMKLQKKSFANLNKEICHGNLINLTNLDVFK